MFKEFPVGGHQIWVPLPNARFLPLSINLACEWLQVQSAYNIKLMLSRISWALAQISCTYMQPISFWFQSAKCRSLSVSDCAWNCLFAAVIDEQSHRTEDLRALRTGAAENAAVSTTSHRVRGESNDDHSRRPRLCEAFHVTTSFDAADPQQQLNVLRVATTPKISSTSLSPPQLHCHG